MKHTGLWSKRPFYMPLILPPSMVCGGIADPQAPIECRTPPPPQISDHSPEGCTFATRSPRTGNASARISPPTVISWNRAGRPSPSCISGALAK